MNIIDFFVPKKDHVIVLRHQLSWYLIPLLLLIWFLMPKLHNIFSITMICICIIGIIETIFFTPVTIISKIYATLGHLILLIPIFYSKILKNSNKFPKKSCFHKYQNERKIKNVTFSNNVKNYYNNNIRYLLQINIWSFLLLIIGILIIYYLPYWPYFMSKKIMISLLISITIFIWIYTEYF